MLRLGDYTVLGKIGAGATAEILLAQRADGSRVALKRLFAHLQEDTEVCAAFFDEARITARLVHPRVVQVLDLCAADDSVFTVLELVDGPSLLGLQKLCGARPVPIEVVAHVLHCIADALAFVHEATDPATGTPLALVHRDVAPANILVSRAGEVKLTDFGIARSRTAKKLGILSADTTRGGVVKGRRAYVSPEQIKGEQLDGRSDLYSLGVVAWELCAGRRMHPDISALDLIERIVHTPAPTVASVRNEVPHALAELIDGLLQKDRAQRPASARDVRDNVRAQFDGRDLQSSTSQLVVSLGLPSLNGP